MGERQCKVELVPGHCADGLMDQLLEMLDDDSDIDSVAVVFGLWIHMTRYLAEYGWNPDELSELLHRHMAEQTTEGHA